MDARSNMIDVIQKLEKLKFENNYTNYKIAKLCGISESTIINIYERNSIPHIDTLEKICNAFGLSLSQFLLEDEENLVPLNISQREMFKKWQILSEEQKKLVNEFIDILYRSNK